jgi:Protein of unknown function (DUF1822)
MFTTYFDATDWIQSIPEPTNRQAWDRSRRQTNAWAQWNAYLNQICLAVCLENFKADFGLDVASLDDRTNDRHWGLVNGSVVTVDGHRIALIPSEVVDQSELEVPQEWVDIPSWAADYYLAIYLMPDMQSLHLAGFATHQQLKQEARLDLGQRSYHLGMEALTQDLNLLGISTARYSSAQTRAAIAPPAPLSDTQAQNLIQRLGSPTELLPRLEVPFALWAALLDQPKHHAALYRQRQGETSLRLGAWLQGQFDRAWQPIEAALGPQNLAVSTRSNGTEVAAPLVQRVKVLDMGNGSVGLLIKLTPVSDAEARIEVQIHPIGEALHLPGETELRLLSPEGSEIAQAKASVTETIRLQFRANYGEAFQLEVSCNDRIITEQFAL